jgi:hypothetical protein
VDRERIHPSHDLRENGSERYSEGIFAGRLIEYGPDPHTTGWYCARCQTYTCMFCPEGGGAGDDDELKASCAGVPWWDRED